MPKIACPGCQKVYKLPQSALGRSATCKECGKKFRLPSPDKAEQPAAEAKTTANPPSPAEPTQGDGFSWDEALSEEFQVEAPAEEERPNHLAQEALAKAEAEVNAPEKKVRWGFQWEKVATGAAMFLGAGIAVLVLPYMRRITIGLIAVAIVGFFTMLSGLMGEEGIW